MFSVSKIMVPKISLFMYNSVLWEEVLGCLRNSFSSPLATDKHVQRFLLWYILSQQTLQAHNMDRGLERLVCHEYIVHFLHSNHIFARLL